jgi:hypothetical protein
MSVRDFSVVQSRRVLTSCAMLRAVGNGAKVGKKVGREE